MPSGMEWQINNQNARASPTQHKSGLLQENSCVPTNLQFIFSALHDLYRGPLLAHGSWQLFQSCNFCANLTQMGQVTSTARKNSFCSFYYNFNSGTRAIGKTSTLASKTSTTITAWWRTSNWKQMPLGMECQISNENSRASPTQHNLDCNEKAGAYLQLYSFIFVLCKHFT